jgi:hypothetical protein
MSRVWLPDCYFQLPASSLTLQLLGATMTLAGSACEIKVTSHDITAWRNCSTADEIRNCCRSAGTFFYRVSTFIWGLRWGHPSTGSQVTLISSLPAWVW